MDKIGQPRGLVRYSADRAMALHYTPTMIRLGAFRPRVKIYCAILLLIVGGVGGALYLRVPLKLDVIRDRGSMGREVDDGAIENVYRLQIMNTSERARRFHIGVAGVPTLALSAGVADYVDVAATETLAYPVRVRSAAGAAHAGSNKIDFTLAASDDAAIHVTEHAVFIVPR